MMMKIIVWGVVIAVGAMWLMRRSANKGKSR